MVNSLSGEWTWVASQEQKGTLSFKLLGIFVFTASHIAIEILNTTNTVQPYFPVLDTTPFFLFSAFVMKVTTSFGVFKLAKL